MMLPVIDDAVVEGPETVVVTLTAVTAGSATLGTPVEATNTIADDDAATVSIANTTDGTEPGTDGVMTVTQTAVSTTDTVISYGVAGTATAGADFTALSGTVTSPSAGDTTATIDIPVIDDAIVEGPETVVVTLDSCYCLVQPHLARRLKQPTRLLMMMRRRSRLPIQPMPQSLAPLG